MTPSRSVDDRRVVQLLGAAVALLAVLVVGLGVAGALAWREVGALRRATAALGERAPGDTLKEVATRQGEASRQLAATVRDAERQIAQFQRRADELRSREGGGPMVVAARAVELMQLMTDQMMRALKQATAAQDVLAKAVRPLGAQEAVAGAGADGDRGARAGRHGDPQRGRDARGDGAPHGKR